MSRFRPTLPQERPSRLLRAPTACRRRLATFALEVPCGHSSCWCSSARRQSHSSQDRERIRSAATPITIAGSKRRDASLGNDAATPAKLADVVNTWVAPSLPTNDWCADRVGNELHVYSVVGWVRIFRHERDTDRHIELTATTNGSIKQCMIAEIPRATYSPLFKTARQNFSTYIKNANVDSTGHVKRAVQLRFTGAAFFDGWHLTHGITGTATYSRAGCGSCTRSFELRSPDVQEQRAVGLYAP